MKKSKVSNIVFLLSLSLFGCHESAEFFIGKWQILSVVENNENFELKENWMHLKSNGTFTSYDGELNKTESGFWKYDNKTNELLIDGEATFAALYKAIQHAKHYILVQYFIIHNDLFFRMKY